MSTPKRACVDHPAQGPAQPEKKSRTAFWSAPCAEWRVANASGDLQNARRDLRLRNEAVAVRARETTAPFAELIKSKCGVFPDPCANDGSITFEKALFDLEWPSADVDAPRVALVDGLLAIIAHLSEARPDGES